MKRCLECGTKLITKQKSYCSRECMTVHYKKRDFNYTYKTDYELAQELLQREQLFKEEIETKYTWIKYHSGYINRESKFVYQCRVCGELTETSCQIVKPSWTKKTECPHCKEQQREKLKLVREEHLEKLRVNREESQRLKAIVRENNKLLKAYQSNHRHYNECVECGKRFFNAKEIKCCSDLCRKKYRNRVKELNRRTKIAENGEVDKSISITKLIKRDNNTCHICGTECNGNDFIINEEGYHIAGNDYPSVDHVLPISKGGTHTWDNVKLAHRLCNSLKKDNPLGR